MQLNPSAKIRTIIYVVTAIGTPLIGYLFSRNIIGELEVALWGSEVTIVSLMAGINASEILKK